MSSAFDQDPLQELTQAVRQATPSVNEQLLTSEAVTAWAEQIARELEEKLLPPVPDEDSVLLQELGYLAQTSEATIQDVLDELLKLKQSTQVTVTQERDVTGVIGQITVQFSQGLESLTQELKNLASELNRFGLPVDRLSRDIASFTEGLLGLASELNRFGALQKERLYQEDRRSSLVSNLVMEFASSQRAFSQAIRKRPKKPIQRPTKSDIAKEAQFLAEAQVRRDLLNQQRQSQLKQGRIVFLLPIPSHQENVER